MKIFGLLLSVFFISCFSNEIKEKKIEEKKVDNTFLSRDNYSLRYLTTWRIDSSDIDFDIDNYFTFDSPDQSFITFFIFNTSIDAKENLEEQINAHLKRTFKNGAVEYFSKWGVNYNGSGAIIKGKAMGIFKSELEIFCYSTPEASFISVSQINESDKAKDSRGIELIKNTFKLKSK
ncbi:MAG: hypothetical protein KA319_02655 [Ferruginibacter sp.]|nr:hypothetical protein [Ferruginibacter sp.]